REVGLRDRTVVRQSARELLPRRAPVGGLVDSATGSPPLRIFPRALPLFPQCRVDDRGVRRIDVDIVAAGVDILEQDSLERLTTVGRSKDPAFFIRSVGMPGNGHEQPTGVAGIDGDVRDLLTVVQAEVRPGLTGVRGLIDAVSN